MVNEVVYQFKRYTNSQMDKLDALLSRAGYKGTPDFNKMTWTTKDKNSKIAKIIKSKGGKKIKESVSEYGGMSKWQQDRLDQRSKEKAPKGKKVSKALHKKQDAWAKKYYTKGGGINIAKWKKDGSPGFPKESVNEAGMEMNKLKDAIKMFQKKIEKQGRVTNARDEEHLSNLIKLYIQMGGKGIKESDLGLTYKKGKTVKVRHKTSGKSIIIIDKPNVRKEYEKIGFYAEGFGGDLKGNDKKKFEKARKENAEQLGYELTGKSDIRESVNEGQKKFASKIVDKFDQAFLKFSREVRDVIKMMDRSTGSKVDGKIIDKAYSKGLIPLDKLMKSWDRGQQSNPKIDEKVIKVSKKDDVPGNAMKMSGEEKIKKLTYSGSNGTGSYEIKGKNLNVIGIRPRDKGFFVRHFTMKTGFRKANLYYDGVSWMDKNKKF